MRSSSHIETGGSTVCRYQVNAATSSDTVGQIQGPGCECARRMLKRPGRALDCKPHTHVIMLV